MMMLPSAVKLSVVSLFLQQGLIRKKCLFGLNDYFCGLSPNLVEFGFQLCFIQEPEYTTEIQKETLKTLETSKNKKKHCFSTGKSYTNIHKNKNVENEITWTFVCWTPVLKTLNTELLSAQHTHSIRFHLRRIAIKNFNSEFWRNFCKKPRRFVLWTYMRCAYQVQGERTKKLI